MNAITTKTAPSKRGRSVNKEGCDGRSKETSNRSVDPLVNMMRKTNPEGDRLSIYDLSRRMASMPLAMRHSAAISLERTKGNRFVEQLAVHAKMTTGTEGNRYGYEPNGAVDRAARMTRSIELIQRLKDNNITYSMQKRAEFKPNLTGMPDQLKEGIESLSGIDMSDVKVHANSKEPARLNALAYAQGNQIYLGPGQEMHLPHEAWHAVQQAQGRVKPTMDLKDGILINDNIGLEHEADIMGAKAAQMNALMQVRETKINSASWQKLHFQYDSRQMVPQDTSNVTDNMRRFERFSLHNNKNDIQCERANWLDSGVLQRVVYRDMNGVFKSTKQGLLGMAFKTEEEAEKAEADPSLANRANRSTPEGLQGIVYMDMQGHYRSTKQELLGIVFITEKEAEQANADPISAMLSYAGAILSELDDEGDEKKEVKTWAKAQSEEEIKKLREESRARAAIGDKGLQKELEDSKKMLRLQKQHKTEKKERVIAHETSAPKPRFRALGIREELKNEIPENELHRYLIEIERFNQTNAFAAHLGQNGIKSLEGKVVELKVVGTGSEMRLFGEMGENGEIEWTRYGSAMH